jgi:hypothetical protein
MPYSGSPQQHMFCDFESLSVCLYSLTMVTMDVTSSETYEEPGCSHTSSLRVSVACSQADIIIIIIIYNTYIETVNTTAFLLSRHVSVLIGPSSDDVHISNL